MFYKQLAEVYSKLESTTKRLEKTWLLSRFFFSIKDDEDLSNAILLAQGRVFPAWDAREIGIASKLVIKAISRATGVKSTKIESLWAKLGDLGLVAENSIKDRKQQALISKPLTVRKVLDNLIKASELEGSGTVDQKVALISELINLSTAIEARYIVRTILGELRIGIAEGMIRDAITWAFLPMPLKVFGLCNKCGLVPRAKTGAKACAFCGSELVFDAATFKKRFKKGLEVIKCKEIDNCLKKIESIKPVTSDKQSLNIRVLETPDYETARTIYNKLISMVEEAFSLVNDYSQVAVILKDKGLKALSNLTLTPGKPIRVMLAQKVDSIEEGFERVEKPAAIEYKYDGFRMQVHKVKGKEIKIFTRRLEDVTKQFPDVVEAVNKSIKADSFIVDGECVGVDVKTKKFVPFQEISQRIKRKYNIKNMIEKLPVELHLFDIVFLNGKTIIKKPFKHRRKLLESIIKPLKRIRQEKDVEENNLSQGNKIENRVKLAEQLITADITLAKQFEDKSLKAGNEGIMMKALNAVYKPGSRVGFMVKLKPTPDTFDLVIIGAEWGEGKRAHWLSSFVVACKDETTGEFLGIGKVGTGIKEKSEGVSFEQLTELLKPYIIEEKGKKVKIKPYVIVEISFQEIQKSPTYDSGFALRFPRVLRIRFDKSVEEATTLDDIYKAYEKFVKK